jgi:hypothetical protein
MDSRSNSLIETPGSSGRDRYRQPDEQAEAGAGAGQQGTIGLLLHDSSGSRAVSAAMRDHPWGPNENDPCSTDEIALLRRPMSGIDRDLGRSMRMMLQAFG